MKKRIAILAAVLTLVLLASACGKTESTNADPETSEEVVTTITEVVIDTTEPETETITETETEPITEPGTEEAATTTTAESTATDAPTTEPTTTTAAKPVPPKTKKEILAAYTKVVDKVKIDRPQYTSNDWQTMSNVDMSGIVYGVASTAARSFLETKEQSSPGIQTAGEHPTWFALPTDSLKAGCVLTDTGKVASASCKESGDYYIITITLVEEKDPSMNKGDPKACNSWHGRMFDVIEFADVIDVARKLPGIDADKAYCNYTGTATLKYNPVTNECVTLDHIIDVRVFLGLGSGAAKVIADYHFYDFKWVK